jgi:lipopolysaccharide export system permease protein
MKKLDWYILRKYLTTFFFCLLLLTVIVVVIDVSEKTDDFVKSNLPASKIITDYYFGFIPRIVAMLFPIFVFISVIFFTSMMANRSEIIAILSSGISFRRFLLPYWIGGLLLAGTLWWANQYMIPKANEKWGSFEARYIDINFGDNRNVSSLSNFYFKLDSFSYAGVRYYDTISKMGNTFMIQKFNGTRLVYNLRAQLIAWDTAVKKWKLESVVERHIDGQRERIVKQDIRHVMFNFKPSDLRRDEYTKDKLTTPELKRHIELEKLRGSEQISSLLVERYVRDSIPVSVLILTLIGAIIASRKIRGGSGFHLALGVIISVVYILLGRFANVFAVKGNFSPILAAWTPNIIFAFLAVYIYRRAPK